MSVGALFYKGVSRKFSTLLLGVAAGAFVFDFSFNKMTDLYWNSNNKGKLWRDIEPKIRAAALAEAAE
uniref:Complex III subunit 9 n=1 Tax=Rhabditophanes sp. KR3021 TaxID=114890 RepID=A0AC35U338_9BILA